MVAAGLVVGTREGVLVAMVAVIGAVTMPGAW